LAHTFISTFDATAGDYYGSIAGYADDTMAILLNGTPIVNFRDNSINGPCAQGTAQPGPSCVGAAYSIDLFLHLNDTNTLTIIDWQSGGSAQGVDFAGKLDPVPGPGSLLLLGTGLVGLAKLIARKAHSR
jgi:hypothetical protein